jgi:hypothetical protein
MNEQMKKSLKSVGIGLRAFNESIAEANSMLKGNPHDEDRVNVLRSLYMNAFAKGMRANMKIMSAGLTRKP